MSDLIVHDGLEGGKGVECWGWALAILLIIFLFLFLLLCWWLLVVGCCYYC